MNNRNQYSGRNNNFPERDEEVSFMSSGGGRSQGSGWFGDPEGHAQAGRHSHDNDPSHGRLMAV